MWANVDASGYVVVLVDPTCAPGSRSGLTLHGWVNDGLMACFFFVVGLEIKREFVSGELRDRRTAALPIAAAIGGMVVPALVFVAVTAGTDDTAGVGNPDGHRHRVRRRRAASRGGRVPRESVELLRCSRSRSSTTSGAILVIAVVYSDGVVLGWLAAAAAVVALVIGLRRLTSSPWSYVVPAIGIWVCLVRSGVHATIAGVIVAGLTPLADRHGRPVLSRLEHRVHPWSTFVVLPIFALANAGIVINSSTLRACCEQSIGLGDLPRARHRQTDRHCRRRRNRPSRIARFTDITGSRRVGFARRYRVHRRTLHRRTRACGTKPRSGQARQSWAGSLGAGLLAVATLRAVNRRESRPT